MINPGLSNIKGKKSLLKIKWEQKIFIIITPLQHLLLD